MDKSEKPSSSHHTPTSAGGRDWVPALEVPLGNLQTHEDELLSWLQYPLEDSFDKNYCSEELSMEAPSFVYDAFSNLTLKEGERLCSTGLRAQNSLPSDLTLREREGAGNAHMASHTWGVAAAYDTNRGERVQAANRAMAIGAHRAAGLLFQSGAETFNRVRTNAQPHLLKGAPNLTTQDSGRSGSTAVSRTSKAGDDESRFEPSARRLTSPNFPLFSRALSSSQQDKLGVSAQGRGRDFALKGEQKASVALPTLHAHPTLPALGTPSEAFGAPIISKRVSVCLPQSSTARMTDIGLSSVPFQCENEWQPSTAHAKEAVSTLRTDFTKTSSISRNLGAEAVSMIPFEETLTAPRAEHTSEGAPSFSATASAGLASGSFVGFISALPQIDTKGSYLTLAKGNPYSGAKSSFTTDVEESMHSELARHDSERSQAIKGCGVAFSLKKSRLGAGEELDSSFCPVVTVSGLTTSEPKVWETVERGEITMASPSGDISENSFKEAAASAMKRKAHFAQDIEMESQNFKDGKLTQGSASAAKRSRTAEIHNLSERKRRNKINVKMKTLQDLIPNANKMDKASVLDEAIEYMKLLQSEVQFMSLRTGMAGVPMELPPGMSSAPMQQRLQPPPHLNVDVGAGGLGFRTGMDVIGHPVSGAPYSTCGLQLASSHAGVQEAYGHLRSPRENEAYMLLQQQHMLSNMHANAGMFGAYTIQHEQKAFQSQLPPQETPSDDMQ